MWDVSEINQRAPNPNPPEFDQPGWSRSNDSHPQRKFGCVCSCMACLTPRLQIWVFLICVSSTYLNGSVQLRVGLELARLSMRNIHPEWSMQVLDVGIALVNLSRHMVASPNLRWAKWPIANRSRSANAVNSRKPFRSSMGNER